MKTEETKQTVLITGATSGIGLELARYFAVEGFSLVLVARSQDQLETTARLLAREYAADVAVIPADLSVDGSARVVYNKTRLLGIEVDILVNNAGMGEYGFFAENNLLREMATIQLNIISLMQLTKLYLKHMISRKQGKILQVAALSAYQPSPKMAVYAATKSFVLSFSDALANELKGTGVTLTTLIPGATATNFFRTAGMQYTRFALYDDQEDPAFVAQVAFEALMRGHAHAVVPGVKMQILRNSLRTNSSIAASIRKKMEQVIPSRPKVSHNPVGSITI